MPERLRLTSDWVPLRELHPIAFAGGLPSRLFGVEGSSFPALDGYPQGDGSQHVNFIDAGGLVHELYRSPDPAAQWINNNLTDFAGGETLGGPAFSLIDGYSQDDGSQHVNYVAVGGSGHVHQLYRSPDAQWVDSDLTALSAGTPALGGGLDGYSQDDNSQHVNFIDADGHVHELYLSPEPGAQWTSGPTGCCPTGTACCRRGRSAARGTPA